MVESVAALSDEEIMALLALIPQPPNLDVLHLQHRVGLLEQLVQAQAVALLRVAEWMIDQPGADRRTLHGMTPVLATAPVVLKHMGRDELAAALARLAQSVIDRAATLPEAGGDKA